MYSLILRTVPKDGLIFNCNWLLVSDIAWLWPRFRKDVSYTKIKKVEQKDVVRYDMKKSTRGIWMGMTLTEQQDGGRDTGEARVPQSPGWLWWHLIRKWKIPFLTPSAKLARFQKPDTKFFVWGEDWVKGLEEFHLGGETRTRGPLPTNDGPSPTERISEPRVCGRETGF